MKKISSIIAICLVVILSVPSISAHAESNYRIYTNDSVQNYFNETLYDNILDYIYDYDGSNLSSIYSALDSFSFDLLPNYAVWYRPDQDKLYLYCWTSDTIGFIYNNNYYNTNNNSINTTSSLILSNHDSNHFKTYACSNVLSSPSWSTFSPSSIWTGVQLDNGDYYYYIDCTLKIISFGGDVALYFIDNTSLYNCTSRNDVSNAVKNGTNDSFLNFMSSDFPFINDEGDIVDPVPDVQIESNENHMYFKNCDFGFCEPKGISSYNQFGGAYIYCRYVVDDWVVNHINDYSLQISMETLLDNSRYFRTLTYPLDRDGCLTLPFKNFGLTGSDNVTQGFVVVGNSNQIIDTDYFKVNLYSITTDQSKEEWFDNAAKVYNTLKAFDRYDTIDFYDIEDFYESNVVKYNKFTINLRAVLVSGQDNSGPVARSFNLVTGTDLATDTSGFDNENPFEPDDTSVDFTPSLPSESNSTTPSIIINTGGTWQGTFTGGFDPGYRDLKSDLDADPDDNFSQYLAPFKNNEVGGFVGDFLDDMPTAMKSIFVGGFGVLTLLGIYRFIRRG